MDESDSVTAFEVLELDYQDTLQVLSSRNAEIIGPFRAEYEKLFKALVKSHESEKRLIRKCRELNSEISLNAQSVQTAVKLSQEDQQHIQQMRKEIEAQKQSVDGLQDKESKVQEAITADKDEIAQLAKRIEQDSGMNPDQEQQLVQLRTQRDQLEKDRHMLREDLNRLKTLTATNLEKMQRAEVGRLSAEEHIADMNNQLAEKRAEVEAEKRRKESLETEMQVVRSDNDLQQEELAATQRNIAIEEADFKRVDQEIQEMEEEERQHEMRAHQMTEEKRGLEAKLEQETAKNTKYMAENVQREGKLREKRNEIQQHLNKRDKVMKLFEALKKKERAADEERKNRESERNALKSELKSAQDNLDRLKKTGDSDRKKIEDLLREREILNKNVTKADDRTKKQIDVVKQQETQAVNLQKDISRWKQDAQESKKRILEMEKQREKYNVELSSANSKYFNAQEELRLRDAGLTELKKQIADVQAKRNQQKTLYDAICMDRNLSAKNQQEANEQISEMRRKFKIMFHTTTALKEEIREKDRRLVQTHFKQQTVKELNEKLKDAKEKAHRRMKNLQNIVEKQKTQIKKLGSTIQEAEQERQAQQKELEGVISERDILGAQLIRRNEELALLYEKIKIQQSTLQKGELQYKERVVEVNTIRQKIRNISNEVALAKNQVASVQSLKGQIHHLHKTLLREETKAKALEQELENPMNVHRWRELEGSDPATYDMIMKVKALQKRLISKSQEVREQDLVIQERERLYVQLKNIIARQPGPEVAQQLAVYGENLKEKTSQMRRMSEELQSYHTQVKDLQDEVDRYNKDFQAVKQGYFRTLREQRQGLASTV
uniref:Cilia- and flagella-associated protein 58 central coiled coil domain-containing protein n=1 Tax=Noctiluca scintillans TaxID=2966 RepID=A0A7S1F7F1_NOCSC